MYTLDFEGERTAWTQSFHLTFSATYLVPLYLSKGELVNQKQRSFLSLDTLLACLLLA